MAAHYFPGRPIPEDDEGFFGLIADVELIERRTVENMAAAVQIGIVKALGGR